jgi:uridine phosphorylase
MSERKYHVGLVDGEVGGYVLYPGDPARSAEIARFLDDAHEVAFSREYRTFTGTIDGAKVSAVSSGMGGPSVAIGIEELRELGVHTIIRVGTCGGMQPGIAVGDVVIGEAAMRGEGTPDAYVPISYPAYADRAVVDALVQAAATAEVPYHVGVLHTKDALAAETKIEEMPRAAQLRDEWDTWVRAGLVATEMESATLFVVGRLRGIRVGTICAVAGVHDTDEIHHLQSQDLERVLRVAVDAVRNLIASDRAATEPDARPVATTVG